MAKDPYEGVHLDTVRRHQKYLREKAAFIKHPSLIKSGKYEKDLPVDPVTGRPLAEKWNSMVGSDGNLKSQYQVTDQANTDALNQYRGEAMRAPGSDSQWATSMLRNLEGQKVQGMDDNNAMIGNNRADMMSQLAQSGGMGAGARERAFRNSGRDALMAKQGLLRQNNTAVNELRSQDEKSRMDMLGQTVNMDAARGSYLSDLQKMNTGRSMEQVGADRDMKAQRYMKETEGWAAQEQAKAQKGGSCFAGEMLVAMKDGSHKRIDQVDVGDETMLGGMVTQTIKTLKDWQGDLYDYQGVIVTGSHAVCEDKQFKRVKDARLSKPLVMNVSHVYNLTTEKHIMLIGSVIFADYTETYKTTDNDESLRILNDEFRSTLS